MGNPRLHGKSTLKMAWNPRASSTSKVAALKLFQPACLGLGLLGMLEEGGLGEPFGKASSANTVFVSTRFVPMTDKRPWREGRWLGHSSEAWPYEAVERGLPRPFAKRRKKLGVGKEKLVFVLSIITHFVNFHLKSCIEGWKLRNNISGRKYCVT